MSDTYKYFISFAKYSCLFFKKKYVFSHKIFSVKLEWDIIDKSNISLSNIKIKKEQNSQIKDGF